MRLFFFFNDTATTEIYTLSLHDALPIYAGEGRLGRQLAARNHDLPDPRRELLHGGRIDQTAKAAPEDGAHAHRARLPGRIERAALESRAAVIGERAADRDHLAMRRRVVGSAEIAPARENAPFADDDCTERKIALPGL